MSCVVNSDSPEREIIMSCAVNTVIALNGRS